MNFKMYDCAQKYLHYSTIQNENVRWDREPLGNLIQLIATRKELEYSHSPVKISGLLMQWHTALVRPFYSLDMSRPLLLAKWPKCVIQS